MVTGTDRVTLGCIAVVVAAVAGLESGEDVARAGVKGAELCVGKLDETADARRYVWWRGIVSHCDMTFEMHSDPHSLGICKINIYTEMSAAASDQVRRGVPDQD